MLGFRATGTIRYNRTNKCPLSSKDMKKKDKGTMDWRCDDGNVNVNAVVNVICNHFMLNPTKNARR